MLTHALGIGCSGGLCHSQTDISTSSWKCCISGADLYRLRIAILIAIFKVITKSDEQKDGP